MFASKVPRRKRSEAFAEQAAAADHTHHKVWSRHWAARLLRGTFLGAAAAAITQATTFAMNVLIARVLGKSSYGDWSLVWATFQVTLNLATFGLTFTAARLTAEHRTDVPETFWTILDPFRRIGILSSLFTGCFLFFFGGMIARYGLHRDGLSLLIELSSGAIILSAFATYWTGVLTGLEAYPRLIWGNLLAAFCTIMTVIILLPIGKLWAAVCAITISSAVILFFNRHSVYRLKSPKGHIASDWNLIPKRLNNLDIALPAAASGALTYLAIWSSQAILARNASTVVVADFAAAYTLRMSTFFVFGVANSATGVILASALRNDGGKKLHQSWKLQGMVAVMSTLAALALYALSGPLLSIFGPQFKSTTSLVDLFAVTIPIEVVAVNLYHVLSARRYLVQNFWYGILPREVVRVTVALVLVPTEKAMGLVIAFLCANIVYLIATFFHYWKEVLR